MLTWLDQLEWSPSLKRRMRRRKGATASPSLPDAHGRAAGLVRALGAHDAAVLSFLGSLGFASLVLARDFVARMIALGDSVASLRGSPARLELAHALAELGAGLR
jgi:hypothetical protein